MEVRVGSDAVWDRAEHDLKAAVEAAGLTYTLNPGEGAFYGPKLEFHLRDALGRQWQCGRPDGAATPGFGACSEKAW